MTDGPDRPIRVAGLGCGFIARLHFDNIQAHPGLTAHAFADLDGASAEAFRAEFGGAYATTDVARVLDDPDVDAVVICTPDGLHAEMAIQAARAGKHILLEKPIALTSADALAIAEAVEAAGVVCGVNFKFRFAPAVQHVRARIARPRLMVLQGMMDPSRRGGWKSDPRLSGGVVFDLGSHLFDLASHLCRAEPVRISASCLTSGPLTSESNAYAVVVDFEDGSIATVTIGDLAMAEPASKWFAEIFDGETAGTIREHFRRASVRGPGIETTDFVDADAPHLPGAMRALMDAFARAIHGDAADLPDVQDGVRAVRSVEACIDSTRSRLPVDLRHPTLGRSS